MTAASALSDVELAQAFAERGEGAFAEAYRRYAAVLYGVARQIAPDAAEDCVHDALLRVWRAAAYRPERGSLRAFMIVCVRNEALTRRRSAARRFAGEQRDAQLASASEAQTGTDYVQLAHLRAALTKLAPDLREVIELAYFGARSQTQIAAQLGLPLGTVKSRASLALRTLARAIGPDNG